MTPALQVDDLSSGYGGSTVLNGVSFSVAPGEILALVGKNGMGKTTLLKTIMGFLAARAGGVKLAGKDVTKVPPHLKRRLALAYAPQEQPLFQDLTVRENLRLGLVADVDFERQLARVAQWFPVLVSRLRQRAGTLSGGEQKMLVVSRGLIADPRVFLLDEVTEGLQPSVVDRLAEVLSSIRREKGASLLVVEQHIPFVLGLADRFAIIKRGELVETGAIDADSAERIDEHIRL